MVNYYLLLNVPNGAVSAEIEKAIKEQRRLWNQRANNPKQEIRAEAEQRVKEIAEAERILLNEGPRKKYDMDLNNQPKDTTPVVSGSQEDWLGMAVDYFKKGDYDSMAYVAREATHAFAKMDIAWFWRGVSSSRLGKLTDAKFELNHAIELNPNDVDYYSELADVYMTSDDYTNAYTNFKKASELDAENPFYLIATAEVLRLQEKLTEAEQISKKAYGKYPDNTFAQNVYLGVIHDQMYNGLSHDPSEDMYIVTNEAQLNFMQDKVALMKSLRLDDSDTRKALEYEVDFLDRTTKKKHVRSANLKYYLIALVIGVLLVASNGIIGIFFIAPVIGLYIFLNFKPGWKWNRKIYNKSVRNTGIQG